MVNPHIDDVFIVSEERYRDAILSDAQACDCNIVKIKDFANPGGTRQESVMNGLQAIIMDWNGKPAFDEDTVLIHDAARPMLSQSLINACYEALGEHDGVMPVLPMKDTVYLTDGEGHLEGLLERERLFAGQAPELFRLGKYYEANMRLTDTELAGMHGSSEPEVLAGMDIVTVPGDEGNFKITTAGDLERFKAIKEAAG